MHIVWNIMEYMKNDELEDEYYEYLPDDYFSETNDVKGEKK